MLEDGLIEYEGHDAPRSEKYNKKEVDQPIANASGTLTENGKFFQAAEQFKEGKRQPAKIKVYRSIDKLKNDVSCGCSKPSGSQSPSPQSS